MNFNLSLFPPGKKEQQGQPGESKCVTCVTNHYAICS